MSNARDEIQASFDCPHCDAGWTMGDDAIYTDDIEDENAQQCSVCGGWYQLRCVDVRVEMEATKASEEVIKRCSKRKNP